MSDKGARTTRFTAQASDGDRMHQMLRTAFGDTYNVAMAWINVLLSILGWFSLSVEVFLRHSFGERYLSVTRYFLAWFAFSMVAFGGQAAAIFSIQRNNPLSQAQGAASFWFFQLLYWGYILIGAWHLWQIGRRNKRGELWYSRSFGISHFDFLVGTKIGPFKIDDWTLYRFIEPGVVVVLALIAGSLSGSVAGWLWLAAATMFIKNNNSYSQQRAVILDIMDAEIIDEYYRSAAAGTNKKQTAGFSVVRPPASIDKDGDGIIDVFQGPTPSLSSPDFSDTLRETLGERAPRTAQISAAQADVREDQLAADIPSPSRTEDDTRPFDGAVPQTSTVSTVWSTATEQPIAAKPLWLRLAVIGGVILVSALALINTLGRGSSITRQDISQPTASGDALPIVLPSAVPTLVQDSPIIQLPGIQGVTPIGVDMTATLVPTDNPTQTASAVLPTTATTRPTVESTPTVLLIAAIPAERISVSASQTAPQGQDACQNSVSYAAENVKDGDPSTAWRVLGDGVGSSLRLSFDTTIQITELQIFAGYGKNDPCPPYVDRWPQGYRASVVELRFSDGTQERRELADLRQLQSLTFSQPIRSEWLEISIRESYPPLRDGAPRPYAAISDIVVMGSQP